MDVSSPRHPSSYLSPEPVDQTTGPLFDRRHRIENHVLAEASPNELHARGQILNEINWDDAGGQTEVVDAVAVDRRVEEIPGLLKTARIVVPRIRRTHQERREHERVLVEKQAPRAHHARALGEAVAIAVKVQELTDLIIPAEDAFDVVAAVLLDRRAECALHLR